MLGVSYVRCKVYKVYLSREDTTHGVAEAAGSDVVSLPATAEVVLGH